MASRWRRGEREGAGAYPYFDVPFAALAHRGGSVPAADHPAQGEANERRRRFGGVQELADTQATAGTVGIENTLAAFADAVTRGYRYLETDVHATADDHLIAFHDDSLDRVTDSEGPIAERTFEQVRRARVGGREQIPTLDEILDAFPDARVNIDIKSPAAVPLLARTIHAHQAFDRVCVGSFSGRRLHEFRRLMGDRVATSAGRTGVAWAALVPILPERVGSGGVAFQIPVTHPVAGRDVTLLNPRLIAAAQARDMRVHIWTVNDIETMHALVDLGVDGIVSDRIDLLKSVLVARGLWS